MPENPNPMEEFAQIMLRNFRPMLERMPAEHRRAYCETLINAYARLAVELERPADVAAMLRRVADAIERG